MMIRLRQKHQFYLDISRSMGLNIGDYAMQRDILKNVQWDIDTQRIAINKWLRGNRILLEI
jgi:hypothetical protein